ncbi:MAG: hypothetical protein GY869_14100, partial [Planctomycetes bacterium]|nr:hypothetical protein [Planctomycetota bacterium]
ATGVNGTAHWVGDQVTYSINEAAAGQGTFTIDGSISELRSATPKITGDISFEDFLLDDQFEAILPQRARNFYNKIALRGQADGRAVFRSPSSGLPEDYRSLIESNQIDPMDLIDLDIWASLTEGHILYEDFPYELSQVDAQMEMTNDDLHVQSLVGYHEQSKVSFTGKMHRSGSYNISITGEPLIFDQSLREAFGEQEKQFWDKYNPSGSADLKLDFTGQSSELSFSSETSGQDYKAVIKPKDFHLEMANFKYPLNNITGMIVAEPNHIGLHDLVSIKGAQRIRLNGEIARQGLIKDYNLQFQATELEMDEQLEAALPARLQKLWQTYEPGGRLDMDLTIESQQHDEDGGGIWNIAGQTSITEGRLNNPMPAEQVAGMISGTARYNSTTDTFDLAGEVHNSSLMLKQRSLANLTGLVHYDGHQQELLFDDLSSDFCGGRLAGVLKAGFGETNPGYEIKLLFDDVDLSQFVAVEDTEPANIKQLMGRA